MKPKVIALDWDGTIVDTFPIQHRVFNSVIEQMNTRHADLDVATWPDEATARKYIGKPDHILLTELFGADRKDEAYQLLMDGFWESVQELSPQKPPAMIEGAKTLIETLQPLREKGIKVIVISNKPKEAVDLDIKCLAMEGMFDVVQGYDKENKNNNKPNPLAMDLALNQCGLSLEADRQNGYWVQSTQGDDQTVLPEEILYIGDSNTDRDFARNVSCKLAIIGDGVKEGLKSGERMETHQDTLALLNRLLPDAPDRVRE